MEDFKQYLSEGADEREREAAKQVAEGLAGLRLEKKVAEVAAERQVLLRRRFWRRLILTATLVVIAGVAFLIFRENQRVKHPSLQEPGIQQPIATDNPPNISPQTPAKEQEEKKENAPIAQNQAPVGLPSPRFPSPSVRGENKEDKAWKALLDQVWYTEYPIVDLQLSESFGKADQLLRVRDFSTAYVQLQRLERKMPENDTLFLLKGYCLMEMGEGAEALAYIEKIKVKPISWEPALQWNQGLSLLLMGDKAKALKVFQEIAASPNHPYLEQSKKAILVLR